MDSFKKFIDYSLGDDRVRAELEEMELLDEAGNVSSSVAIKKHGDVIRYGKEVLRSRSIDRKMDALARMMVASSGLALMSVAVSGDSSFMSKLAGALSFRNI